MYHISNDKRSVQSADLIYNGLMECIKKKPFDLITISDLQRASGVARTTFYRSFDNISDVLYWKCDTCFHEVLGNLTPDEFAGEFELARHYFRYWLNNSDILELLIAINRQDIIYACHMKNAEIPHLRYGDVPGLTKEHGNYFVAVRTGFTISILTAWLRGGRKETPDEIIEIVREQLTIIVQNNSLI